MFTASNFHAIFDDAATVDSRRRQRYSTAAHSRLDYDDDSIFFSTTSDANQPAAVWVAHCAISAINFLIHFVSLSSSSASFTFIRLAHNSSSSSSPQLSSSIIPSLSWFQAKTYLLTSPFRRELLLSRPADWFHGLFRFLVLNDCFAVLVSLIFTFLIPCGTRT